MSLTITVTPDVEAAIRAVAQFEGRDPSEVAIDALRVRYVGTAEQTVPTREGKLALESDRHTLEEADVRITRVWLSWCFETFRLTTMMQS